MRIETEYTGEVPADQEAIPTRPGESASRDDWVDYCVALGADKHYLNKTTRHAVSAETVEVHHTATVEDLKDLASNLGG